MTLNFEKRTIAQSGLNKVAVVGLDPKVRIASTVDTTGHYKVFGIRPGLNLTVLDIVLGTQFDTKVRSEPCLAIDVLFEAAGQGWLLPPDGSPGISIPYRSGRMYLFFSRNGASGRYEIPTGVRFRGIDIRVGLPFLERLGALGLFENLDERHPLHAASSAGCWIGALPLSADIAPVAKTLFESGLTEGGDLTMEARCLDMINAAIGIVREPPARDRVSRPTVADSNRPAI